MSTGLSSTTRQDAIDQLIIPALTVPGVSSPSDYDVDAIADMILSTPETCDYSYGYAQKVTTEKFWEVVQENIIDRG